MWKATHHRWLHLFRPSNVSQALPMACKCCTAESLGLGSVFPCVPSILTPAISLVKLPQVTVQPLMVCSTVCHICHLGTTSLWCRLVLATITRDKRKLLTDLVDWHNRLYQLFPVCFILGMFFTFYCSLNFFFFIVYYCTILIINK